MLFKITKQILINVYYYNIKYKTMLTNIILYNSIYLFQ